MAKSKKPTVRIQRVPLAKIERGGTQTRAAMNMGTVAEYVEAIRSGVEFPPVVVFKDAVGAMWLGDGHHRVEAYLRSGRNAVNAEVRDGDQRAAILHGCSANSTHGLRRSPEDKRRAVALLLADPEWSQWSDRAIAGVCAVSHSLVSMVRNTAASTGNEGKRKSLDGKTRSISKIAESSRARASQKLASHFPDHDWLELAQAATEQRGGRQRLADSLGVDSSTVTRLLRGHVQSDLLSRASDLLAIRRPVHSRESGLLFELEAACRAERRITAGDGTLMAVIRGDKPRITTILAELDELRANAEVSNAAH